MTGGRETARPEAWPGTGSGGELETIFAVASGLGRAAVTLVRISGPRARDVLGAGALPSPRRASLRAISDRETGEILDRALVLWMPGPGTATGEDVLELHLHGGVAVRSAVIRTLSGQPRFRAAEPGEFTRRAFLNGRLDLSEAEGLADLVDAETEAQRRQASRQLEGALSREVDRWRAALIDVMAALDAALDFSDEGDVPSDVASRMRDTIADLAAEVRGRIAGAARGERLREGCVAVIAGPPNAGKSTLLNAIARRDIALVSPLPGTTRDALEVRCDIAGLPVTFVDTAGLRDTDDVIEQAGIARARDHAGRADLVIWLDAPGVDGVPDASIDPGRLLRVRSKADLPSGSEPTEPASLALSALTGRNLDVLLDHVRRVAEGVMVGPGDAIVTRERHRVALVSLTEALDRADLRLSEGQEDLAAEDIRLGLRALGRITGTVDVEDVLDVIFSRFCIGK